MSLKKSLNNLLEEGKIKEQKTDIDYLNALLHSAKENFLSAKYNFDGEFYETAFKSSYDGLLQISRVVLLFNGYRPHGTEQHKTTFTVAVIILGKDFEDLIRKMDKYRVKRNNAIYHPVDFVSKKEAENILKISKEYWSVVQEYLLKENSQLNFFDLNF